MKRTAVWIALAAELGLIAAGVVSPAIAVPLDDAQAAYGRNEYATALTLFKPLAEQGDQSAQFQLGVMYGNGQGVRRDYAEAEKWYRRAANQGNAQAQNSLGFVYTNGQGVERSYFDAYKWFSLAAVNGYTNASKNSDLVVGRLTPAQIAEADRYARDWKPVREIAKAAPNTNAKPVAAKPELAAKAATNARPATEARPVAAKPEVAANRATNAQPLTDRKRIAEAQREFIRLGFDLGPADGVAGARTVAAVKKFQGQQGLSVDGVLTEPLVARLRTTKR